MSLISQAKAYPVAIDALRMEEFSKQAEHAWLEAQLQALQKQNTDREKKIKERDDALEKVKATYQAKKVEHMHLQEKLQCLKSDQALKITEAKKLGEEKESIKLRYAPLIDRLYSRVRNVDHDIATLQDCISNLRGASVIDDIKKIEQRLIACKNSYHAELERLEFMKTLDVLHYSLQECAVDSAVERLKQKIERIQAQVFYYDETLESEFAETQERLNREIIRPLASTKPLEDKVTKSKAALEYLRFGMAYLNGSVQVNQVPISAKSYLFRVLEIKRTPLTICLECVEEQMEEQMKNIEMDGYRHQIEQIDLTIGINQREVSEWKEKVDKLADKLLDKEATQLMIQNYEEQICKKNEDFEQKKKEKTGQELDTLTDEHRAALASSEACKARHEKNLTAFTTIEAELMAAEHQLHKVQHDLDSLKTQRQQLEPQLVTTKLRDKMHSTVQQIQELDAAIKLFD